MALIACPDCGKDVSDEAPTCQHCGCPVAARLQRIRAEAEALRLQQEAEAEAIRLQQEEEARRVQREKERNIGIGIGVVVLLIIFTLVHSCNSPSPTGTVLLKLDNQSISATPEVHTFHAVGSLLITYSCQSTSAVSIRFTLMNATELDTVVWQKSVTCPASGSDTLQIPSGTDLDLSVSGDATWSINIAQA